MEKRKLFILGIYLSVAFCSCSDELEIPESRRGTNTMENFGIADARQYFEENATDLSLIRFSDSIPKTRSDVLPRAELTPDWDKAIQSTNGDASLIEIPILSNTVMFSTVRCFEEGKSVAAMSGLSNIRLVVARRKNGQSEMFVVTLVPSAKYTNTQKSTENFRYLGGGNFTGKVFCSTLDGRFVDASQYVNGRFVGVLKVTTRQQLAKRNIQLDNESYESIMFTPGVKTRSGTYAFGESGGTSNMCEWHPQYPASECPYCLSEVIVRYCPDCHSRLEDGETCNCKCSWCHYYPCRCCFYCHDYPCTCASTCPTCRPDPCTRCPKCERHYCFGSCESSGSGGSGSGEGGGGSDEGGGGQGSSERPLSKAIFNGVSNLTEAQWKRVEQVLENINKDCMGGKLIREVRGSDITVVHISVFNGNGRYEHTNNRLVIQNFKESDPKDTDIERTIFHELLHSVQSGNTDSALNQEIEVHVAVHKYALKHGVALGKKKYESIRNLSLVLEENYKINDPGSYDSFYEEAIQELKKVKGYENYGESSSARNFNTVERLAKDC